MIEKINPAIPIPIESSSIPDEQREITIAKSNIAIPNPIFFIENPPLQIPVFHSDHTDEREIVIFYFDKRRYWQGQKLME